MASDSTLTRSSTDALKGRIDAEIKQKETKILDMLVSSLSRDLDHDSILCFIRAWKTGMHLLQPRVKYWTRTADSCNPKKERPPDREAIQAQAREAGEQSPCLNLQTSQTSPFHRSYALLTPHTLIDLTPIVDPGPEAGLTIQDITSDPGDLINIPLHTGPSLFYHKGWHPTHTNCPTSENLCSKDAHPGRAQEATSSWKSTLEQQVDNRNIEISLRSLSRNKDIANKMATKIVIQDTTAYTMNT